MLNLSEFTLPPGRWCGGVSGGGDSMALAHLLHRQGAQVAWAHFNHRWSAWGDEAEAFVTNQANSLNNVLHLGCGLGKPLSNAEALGRTARHDFFKQLVAEHGYSGVVLAHTQTDVAENFLLRAGKGSGVRGLARMPSDTVVNGLRIIRPLLKVSRAELRAWLQAQQLPWLDDPDISNQRAKIRALLPLLAAAGVPEHGLAAAAAAAARAQAAIAAQVAEVRAAHPTQLPLARLQAAAAEVQLQILGEILAQHTAGPVVRTSKRQGLLEKIAMAPHGKATLGGLVWQWRDGVLRWEVEG